MTEQQPSCVNLACWQGVATQRDRTKRTCYRRSRTQSQEHSQDYEPDKPAHYVEVEIRFQYVAAGSRRRVCRSEETS